MRKLFFTIPVVLALLVSAVFTVQKAMAVGTASWVCTGSGATLSWNQTPGNPWTITTPIQTLNGITNASGTLTFSHGDGTYRYVHAADGIDVSITCPIPKVAAPAPPPFAYTPPSAPQRIDPDPGEPMAVFCYPGGWVDLWDTTTPNKTTEFAATTYSELSKIITGTTVSLNNLLVGSQFASTFTVTRDITGRYFTAVSADGKLSKTFTASKCEVAVNYKVDSQVNYPQVPTYTVKTSAAITNQLDAAKKRLASAVGAAAIAQAQADVARWEALYRPNNTVITENFDASIITFAFSDGVTITVLKDGTVK